MTESSTPIPETSLLPDQQEKLRDLTAQSWNLELVISGAALFAVLQIPDLLDQLFDYLRYNFMSQAPGAQTMLPSLAYSMMKATCYILFMAFLANFVMRAFWVGLVGLLAVYPTGIHYDRIPFTTPYFQKKMADDLGPLDRYIMRLDQRCNIVFAVAFLFVFLLIFVALSYLTVLLIYSVLRPALPPQAWQLVKIAGGVLFGLFFLASIVLTLPKVRTNPAGIIWHSRMMTASRLVLWGLYKPYIFIINTFYSHLPLTKILRTMVVMLIIFFVFFMAEYTSDLIRTDRRTSALNRRHLYTARVDSLFINPTAYDNQRAEDANVDVAAIQADVIREPFIRLFIAYPKALDTMLTRVAIKPTWSEALPLTERHRLVAEWSSQQTNRLMRITINDSLYAYPDLLFTKRSTNEQRGWQTILMPGNLRTGKNTLRIAMQADSLTKPQELTTIPFWYVPEN